MDLDLTFPSLPDGRYDVVIHAIDLKRYTTVLLCICYRIPFKGRDFFVWEELAIDAPASSPGYSRTAQGKGRNPRDPQRFRGTAAASDIRP